MSRRQVQKQRHPAVNPANGCAIGVVIAVVIAIILVLCGIIAMIAAIEMESPAPANTATVELAFTPEKETLMQDIITRFNRANYKTPSGQTMSIVATKMEAPDMVEAAKLGKFHVLSPDSSLWLAQIDAGRDAPLVGEATRFAVTPVVMAMWSDVAQSLGYPQKQIGWQDLLDKAKSDPNFKWSHPSTNSASGTLATLAEFYAGAGKTRNLTEEDVKKQTTLDYVAALEKTVRYYGEGEQAVVDQVLAKGRSYLDAFIISERLVIFFNGKSSQKLVAIYPVEGTLWQDHPIALLEQTGLTNDQRLTYRKLRDFVLSSDIQKLVMQSGYRPVDLKMKLDDPASPIKTANGVDPAQPQTTLQMPSDAVIEIVQSSWYLAKRAANIYLVVDTSGSMADDNKLVQAKDAINIFIDQILGERDRVGLVPFSNNVYGTLPLLEIGVQRTTLKNKVNAFAANGRTAMLDGVAWAHDDLARRNERDRINAIVVMTDGLENASSIKIDTLTQRLKQSNKNGLPIIVFGIAYGNDADLKSLNALADATNGFARTADPDTIRRLYKILSTYF